MTRPTCPYCGSRLHDSECDVCKEDNPPLPPLDALLARMRRARECIETLAKEDAQHEQPA